MAPLLLLFVFWIQMVSSQETCQDSCNSGIHPVIRFPFGLKANYTNDRCSYPGFNLLSCNRTDETQTVLNLPHVEGDFNVEYIDYSSQVIYIQDPENCLAKRFIKSFDLSETPFLAEYSTTFAFLKCPVNTSIITGLRTGLRQVSCLSNENYTVVAVASQIYEQLGLPVFCSEMHRRVSVPLSWPLWSEGYTRLLWAAPDCGTCESRGGICGFKSESTLEVGCSNLSRSALPRSAKYGMVLGLGIPGLLCIVGLGCFLCRRIRAYGQRHHPTTQFSTSVGPQPSITIGGGLDGPTIESFPKTQLGESRRLPNPTDNSCPICLSEYQSKDTLRSIPECNHYFHAGCIDEWLKMNGTCPLCRNSLDGSSGVTPSASMFSSSRSSSS